MTEPCTGCDESKRLNFEIKGLDLEMTAMQREIGDKTYEYDTMVRSVCTRMDTMQHQFSEFQTEVKKDIQSIKDEIPAMFESSVNAMVARIAKWVLVGIGSFLLIVIVVVVLAFTRPYIVHSLEELLNKAQTIEVTK